MTGRRRETIAADAAATGQRLDLFLVCALGASRKAVKRALDGGQVFVDGRVIRQAGHLLSGRETVAVTMEAIRQPAPASEPAVLFQDEHLLALAKPTGFPSHPTVAERPNALGWATALLHQEGISITPILLHRLDADTSGVLLFALTRAANRILADAFAGREMEKIYLALVGGVPPDTFTVTNFLRAGRRGRVEAVRVGGQPAETAFRTLSRCSGFALVEARPKTGRTHQIRVHLAGEGYPLLGDRLYGGATAISIEDRVVAIPRHLLHAFQLVFRHPVSDQSTTLEAPIPLDFQEIIKFFKTRCGSWS